MSTENAAPVAAARAETQNRIIPEPPTPDSAGAESLDVWGFTDSGFEVNDDGDVTFTGSRYPISGQVLADFLPWARETIDAPLEPFDIHESGYPTHLPDRKPNEGFENDLVRHFRSDQIQTDPHVRLRHGHGHTQEDMWAIKYGRLERVPDLVVQPESDDEVRILVDLAGLHRVCLIPYGAGTNVSDALRCPREELRTIASVDMRRMNRVLWIDPENRMACIQAGANGREIDEQLGRHGFTLGHEPDSYEFSTMGGWVATHASGMKKNRYGNIEDIVLGVTAVTAGGVLTRQEAPPRESVGGDPARWMIGSEGRLGIVTRADVKIFPLPAAQKYGSVLFHDFAAGVAFLREAQESRDLPASIRLMDNFQFQFGQALKPRKVGLAALKSRLEKLVVLGLKGFDKDRMVACTLLFEGTAEEIRRQERTIHAIAARHGGMKSGAENGRRGYQLTFSIAYIRDFMLEHSVLAESFETSVAWSNVVPLVENVKQRLWQEHAKRNLPGKPFVSARVTQLYDTGVCVYFYFGYYHKGVDRASDVYAQMERVARDEILRAGGSLSHHHGIGKLRQRFLPQVLSDTALSWRRDMKRALDPDDIFGCSN
ncbi:MAG: FAD-binding oxidoreductase [Deltaproteobacteria bacterium]|nr:FAD-binding oxidoreductase [Deltaproteobacteria bacterium]MBW2361723.1 FAD-binding oxidoreductase [Deltaproteobacteria bacterium]